MGKDTEWFEHIVIFYAMGLGTCTKNLINLPSPYRFWYMYWLQKHKDTDYQSTEVLCPVEKEKNTYSQLFN